MSRRLRFLLAGAILCGVYVGLAEAGQSLGEFGAYSVWYLPAGVALAVSMLSGWRWWPALAISELISGIVVFHVNSHGFTWPLMILNASIYTGIYVLAGAGLRHAGITYRADRVRDVLTMVAIAAVLAPFIAALFGVAIRIWAHASVASSYWPDVRTWWVGDALGIATVAPGAMIAGLLAGAGGRRMVPPGLRRRGLLVTIAQLLIPAVAAALLLAVWGYHPAVLSLLAIPVVGVALRFGVAGTALATLMLAPTVAAVGHFQLGDVLSQRSDLQILLLGIVSVGFLVGSVVDERDRTSQRQKELAQVVESASDLVAVVGLDGQVRYLNQAGRRLAGIKPNDDVRALRESDLYGPGPDRTSPAEAQATAVRERVWSGDVYLRGSETAGEALAPKVAIAHYARDGRPLRTTSIVRDVGNLHAAGPGLHAGIDHHTGLPNRAGFLAQLAQARRRLEYRRSSATLLAVEFDKLVELHAALGRDEAGELVKRIGARLIRLSGAGAVVGWIDGSRFAILSGDTPIDPGAGDLAREICEARFPVPISAGSVSLTPRVGVSEVPGQYVDEADALLAAEVAARHAVSHESQNPVYDRDHRRSAQTALVQEAQLRRSLELRSWHLVYQPIVEAASLRVTGAEALLRFDEADHASSPFSMILLAEQLGLIAELGRQVLDAACREAANWPASLAVSVNVSRHQLTSGFVEIVSEVLDRTTIAPARLVLEVTESALAGDARGLVETLEELHGLGVRIALDDFGTGYSCLANLDSLPVDSVKLDATFTRGLADFSRKRSLVGAVIMLANTLEITAVAEGIESAEELNALVELGCHEAQGFLLARPGPATALRTLPSMA